MEVAEKSQVDVAVSRPAQGIARRIPIGSPRPDASWYSRTIGNECGCVKPCCGCNRAAPMWVQKRVDPGNHIGPIVILAVEVLVRAGHNFERRPALQINDG